jgi:hypothetical protein
VSEITPSGVVAPLQLDSVRQKEEIFDFAELVKEMIPIDPVHSLTTWSEAGRGQATKGTGWMPWRQEPMKDVAGCEKLRGVASRQ